MLPETPPGDAGLSLGVSVVKKITLLLMTMALAVAMVACSGAVGKPGEAGKAGEPGKAALQPPYVALEIDDVTVVQGISATVTESLSMAFRDPEGKTLIFSAEPGKPAIATAAVSGAMLTVTGVGVGTTSVVVTATDPDKLSVGQSFKVTVTAAPPEPVPPVTIADVKMKYPRLSITPTTATTMSEEIELPADHKLMSGDDTVVTVAMKPAAASAPATSIRWASATDATTMAKNVWEVTAVSKGITDVDVLDKTGASVHTIRVTVTANLPATLAPVMAKGSITTRTVVVGTPETVALADYFTVGASNAPLTYVPASSKPAFATVAEASGVLTITGVAAGPSEITVTATDAGKNTAMQKFMVTVKVAEPTTPTEPTTPAGPPMLTVANTKVTLAVGGKATLTVAATDEVIAVDASTILEIMPTTSTTYSIKAVKKGSASIQIYAANNTLLGTIAVTVSNQAPTLNTKNTPKRLYTLMEPAQNPPIALGETKVYVLEENLNKFFTDADGDVLTFTAKSKNSRNAVVAGISKEIETGTKEEMIYIDIVDHSRVSFDLEITAMDSAKVKAKGSVVLTAKMAPVLGQAILVQETPLSFIPVDLGYRKGAQHMLTFGTNGFDFSAAASFMPKKADGAAITHTPTSNTQIEPPNTLTDGRTEGASYYKITPSNGIKVEEFAAATHVLSVAVLAPGRQTITVVYRVWEETKAEVTTSGEEAISEGKWHDIPRTITVNTNFVPEAETPPTL